MTSGHAYPKYSLSERRADWIVHAFGIAWGLVAVPVLLVLADPWNDWAKLVSCLLYSFGLLWMLGLSTAYNGVTTYVGKGVLRRLDHAGIFLLIAGSYSPFALVKIGGAWGIIIFSVIWSMAALGLLLAVCFPRKGDRLSLILCLVMGWSVLVSIGRLIDSVSTGVFVLLAVGGVLYTAGVGFHLAIRLRYHNAIWHAFVIAAAVCHWVAVLMAMQST